MLLPWLANCWHPVKNDGANIVLITRLLLHPAKAAIPNDISLEGNVIDDNDVHPENAIGPIDNDVKPVESNVTDDNDVHPENAILPIDDILAGIVTDVNLVHPENVLLPSK